MWPVASPAEAHSADSAGLRAPGAGEALCTRATGCPDLGLFWGERISLSYSGGAIGALRPLKLPADKQNKYASDSGKFNASSILGLWYRPLRFPFSSKPHVVWF